MAKKNTQKATTAETAKQVLKKVNISADFGKVVHNGNFPLNLALELNLKNKKTA